jgi:hypothetical protein
LVAKKRSLTVKNKEAPRKETLHVSLDRTGVVIDGMTRKRDSSLRSE